MEVKSDADKPAKKKWIYNPGEKCKCTCVPGEKCTIKKGLKYVQPEIPTSYKPKLVFTGNTTPVSGDTIYKNSYMKFDSNAIYNSKGKPIRPKSNIVSAGDFSSDTTNKMSYGAWKGYQRPQQVIPKDHCLMGEGPLQDMTTTRHDYVPKPIDVVDKIKTPGCLGLSTKPMESNTTNTLSYLWPRQFESAESFRPNVRYSKPETKMCGDTIQKLSFQPWEPQKKEVYPWQKKDAYSNPRMKFCAETIYSNSFFPPGQFVEDSSCSGCYCVTDGECCEPQGNPQRKANQSCHQENTPSQDNRICHPANPPSQDHQICHPANPPSQDNQICPQGYNPVGEGPRLQAPS